MSITFTGFLGGIRNDLFGTTEQNVGLFLGWELMIHYLSKLRDGDVKALQCGVGVYLVREFGARRPYLGIQIALQLSPHNLVNKLPVLHLTLHFQDFL